MTAMPFPAASQPLPGGCLRPLADAEAASLGPALAAIEPYRRLGYAADALAAYLKRPDPALYRYGIETASGLAGVLALRWPWLRGPYIETLAILPAAQGHGLGSQVMRWIIERSGANLWATVSAFNQAARRFYARHGFVELCPLPGLVAQDETEILLRRTAA